MINLQNSSFRNGDGDEDGPLSDSNNNYASELGVTLFVKKKKWWQKTFKGRRELVSSSHNLVHIREIVVTLKLIGKLQRHSCKHSTQDTRQYGLLDHNRNKRDRQATSQFRNGSSNKIRHTHHLYIRY